MKGVNFSMNPSAIAGPMRPCCPRAIYTAELVRCRSYVALPQDINRRRKFVETDFP